MKGKTSQALEAIHQRDLTKIDALLAPVARSSAVDLGEHLVRLAERGGDARVLTRVLRLLDERTRNWTALLVAYIEQISEEATAARWFSGIEYLLWASISDDPRPSAGPFVGLDTLLESERDDLRFLHQRCNGWVKWDDDQGLPTYVPDARWDTLFSDWRRKQKQLP